MARTPQSGDVIGGYTLEVHLARGGMGDVWRARREAASGFCRRVALKRIHPELIREPVHVDEFLREARLGSWLQHPNAVGVLDVGVHEGVPFLVMELVEGFDLKRVALRVQTRDEKLPPTMVGYVIHQALSALEAAHSLRSPSGEPAAIIHRDLSPENILLGFHGEVKVADFGLAKQLSSEERLTRVGMIKGKVAYMSPEQLLGTTLEARSDLYSLGVTFFEMLCGTRPHQAENPVQALEFVRKDPRHPHELDPDIPAPLADLAQRWRQPWPEQRAESLTHALEELEMALGSLLTGVPSSQLAALVGSVLGESELPLPKGGTPCGKCGGILVPRQSSGGVILDQCVDCGGVWLDAYEMARVLGGDMQVTLGTPALEAAALDEVVGDCPRCGVRLQPREVSGEKPYSIEICVRCRGTWFDEGELERFAAAGPAALIPTSKMRKATP